jgi:hypothetical protein
MKTLTAVLVMALASSAALAGIQASPAVPLVPDAGDKTRGQFDPVAAFGKDGYLLVWREGLANREARLFASRVDKSGRALDAKGIALAGDLRFQQKAAVAYGGGSFLVVFSALKTQKGADGLLASGVFAVRVSGEGKVLDEKPIAIGDAPGHQSQPAVAFDGTNFRVAWVALLDADGQANEAWGIQVKGLLEIRTARVSPAGQVLDAGPGALAARGPGGPVWGGLGSNYQPAVACAGGKTMIAFSHGASYPQAVVFEAAQPGPQDKAARIDLPQVVRKVGRMEGKITYPAVAASPKGFAASWSVSRGRGCNGPPWPGMVFDLDGKPIDEGGKGVSPASGTDQPCFAPALAFDGEAYVWTWISGEESLLACRFSPEGKVLDGKDLVLEAMGKDRAGRYIPREFSAASLASDGAGSTLCLHVKYPAAATGRMEVFGRLIRK